MRGKPVGSPIVDNGSLSSLTDTSLEPFPGLLAFAICSPRGVKGAATCPVGWMPALPASHVPERSRRGAGPAGPDGGPDNPALFQGFIWASGRAAAKTVTAAMRTTRRGRIAESSCQRARGLYARIWLLDS